MYQDDPKEYDLSIKDMLFNSNLSIKEIAKELEISETKVSQRIHALGLSWVPKRNRKMSRGQTALTSIMKKLIPGAEIVNEFHVGEQLRLDVYCPKFKLAAEFHGRQHYDFVAMFHNTYDDFIRGQQRDARKIELCDEAGIAVVVFRYTDSLTEEAVFDRLIEGLKKGQELDKKTIKKPKTSIRNSPYYQQQYMKRKAFERELRRKIKEERKVREQNRTTEGQIEYGLDQDHYDEGGIGL